MKNLFFIFVCVIIFVNNLQCQNILLTDLYSNESAFILVYYDEFLDEELGKLIVFSDTLDLKNLNFEYLVDNNAIILKNVDNETFKCIKWNTQHPFEQTKNHIVLNMPDSSGINLDKNLDFSYGGIQFNENICLYKNKINELELTTEIKISVYKVCLSGLVFMVKYGGNEFFIDGKLDTQYIQGKKYAQMFIPLTICDNGNEW